MAEERTEVLVDFDGTGSGDHIEKHLVPEDAYAGVIKSVELTDTKAYNSEEQVKKLVFAIEIEHEGKKIELPLFCNPIIKRSSGAKGYSNSKLFDLIDKAGLLSVAETKSEELKTFAGLTDWLVQKMLKLECKVLVKTTNKNTDSAYSSIKDIVRFESVPVVERTEVK